ncbi:hypothetical protein [Pedobacter alluvionis]|uniref:DUF4377 domain-containing protein n=1 Tax=Pedobacter alluvionis TaxID=475253 RepID=A0A497YG06_9SPHI|nr:hypothetical protein [Pedobacter alluvionis]RLJ80329.1 hypothetical protein BCL90_1084 [Pedobacter alluvionis]TFB31599.1 hypothetical protein E3V97_13515 [Pedobacter alluvionis]
MLKKLHVLGLLVLIYSSCKEKPPFQPDYENAVGSVIGSENCQSIPSENAWLIQFAEPNTGNKTYGENITYNGKAYSNVVKTYQLPDSSKIVGKRYLFEFYLDGKSTQQECSVTDPVNFNILKIRLKNIIRVAN